MSIGKISLDSTRNRLIVTGCVLLGASAVAQAVLAGLRFSGHLKSVPVIGRVRPVIWAAGGCVSAPTAVVLSSALRRDPAEPSIEPSAIPRVRPQPPAAPDEEARETERVLIKALKEQWVREDHELEKERLVQGGYVDRGFVRQVESFFDSHKQDEAAVLLGHAMQIREIYRDTHYVFTHAQGREMQVLSEAMRQAIKLCLPEHQRPLFKHLRNPGQATRIDTVRQFFKRHGGCGSKFSDHTTREDLLSVDGYFYNESKGKESAWHFLNDNQSMAWELGCGSPILDGILKPYIRSAKARADLVTQVVRLATDYSRDKFQHVGCLYLICIPKEEVDDPDTTYVYRSHPFGRRCRHYDGRDTEVLQTLQDGRAYGADGTRFMQCSSDARFSDGHSLPQYRILTEPLSRRGGVRSFLIHTQPKEEWTGLKQELQALIRGALERDGRL